ncbi:polysaccharide biosynthesis protein [Kocuria rhizophila]|nr:polysaccharide biosynthesis protein [Kocuria rhizophila]
MVFHAGGAEARLAAQEQCPDEASRPNVMGSLHVLRRRRRGGRGSVVNISTDEAANPTTALGHSKRVAEKLTAWTGGPHGQASPPCASATSSARAGPCSRCSPSSPQGRPITVTHRTRPLLMTIPEACHWSSRPARSPAGRGAHPGHRPARADHGHRAAPAVMFRARGRPDRDHRAAPRRART